MEALADQQLEEEEEQAEEAEVEAGGGESAESSVRAESLAKLKAFKENPHVDLNESKLATELKGILEEAQRRMEAAQLEKKRKKEEKKVRITKAAKKQNLKNTKIQTGEDRRGGGQEGGVKHHHERPETGRTGEWV